MASRRVYMLRIRGRFDEARHPHVDLSHSGRERVLVPCFTLGGRYVEDHIFEERTLCGFADDEIFVEIDNSRHVTWRQGFAGSPSWWLVSRARVLEETQLGIYAGDLDAHGVKLICEALLKRASRRPKTFRESTLVMLRTLVNECRRE